MARQIASLITRSRCPRSLMRIQMLAYRPSSAAAYTRLHLRHIIRDGGGGTNLLEYYAEGATR